MHGSAITYAIGHLLPIPRYAFEQTNSTKPKRDTLPVMKATLEKVSAITLKVVHMDASVQFYRDVLGMELLYGGPTASFSSLRIPDTDFSFINLQLGHQVVDWGRIIFHVSDVDAFWVHLKQNGFEPDRPQDAPWGERYFHMRDPDGHELSFARPL
jgi:catechol 2,3-dioxygenase-like lactoylglutathione lyase family enzyme